MSEQSEMIEKIKGRLQKPSESRTVLAATCKDILEHFHFDCVFFASSSTPEEIPNVLAYEGKEDVLETCLYRLGVEERVALTKVPLKTFTDMTGKPTFNKSGSLRIQKPGSGVFMVLHRPDEFVLLGCAHLNSQSYDPETLEALASLWQAVRETLEGGLARILSPEPQSPEATSSTARDFSGTGTVPGGTGEGSSFTALDPGSPVKKSVRRPIILVDEVTRLFNRDYFEEGLDIEVDRAKRYSRNVTLIFLKTTPLESGQVKSDEITVATQVAEVLSRSLRRVDIICRIERNLFAIILPDTDNSNYGIIAKRVFRYFKEVMGQNPPITINISASTYPRHAEDARSLYENVEKLLVQAQEVGPNKAVLPD